MRGTLRKLMMNCVPGESVTITGRKRLSLRALQTSVPSLAWELELDRCFTTHIQNDDDGSTTLWVTRKITPPEREQAE